jgi:hypothetical protein
MRLVLACLLVSLSGALAAAEPSVLGYWVNPDDPDDTTSFEADRAITLDHGKIQYWLARYQSGKVILGWLGEASVPYHWQGADIIVDVPPKNPHWHRVATEPKELLQPVLSIPKAASISATRIADITTEIARRGVEDQAVRKDPARQQDMGKVDQDNTAYLKTLVSEVGWIDGARFGKETASRAFLFVQHSGDLPLMQAALPLISADRASGACNPQDFALLYDRVQIMTGHKQRYGSQIGQVNGKNALYPIEDRAHLNELRGGIGLFPIETYLAFYKQLTHADVIYMDDLPVAGMP